MHVVLVVDVPHLCSLNEGHLELLGHTVLAFHSDEAAAAWCEVPDNEFDAAVICLYHHGSAAGLRLACRIARSRPEVKINAAWGGYVSVPDVPASVRVVHKLARYAELFDLGEGRN